MKCRNNPTLGCNRPECESCAYQKSLTESRNMDNAIEGFQFMDESGKMISGIGITENKNLKEGE
jgi:hypothetical protein